MSVGPTRGPVQRPGDDRDFSEIFQRLDDLERVAPGTSAGRIIAGQIYNDAEIIAGTGFSAALTDNNEITVTFDLAFDDPPTVVCWPNNNNPADVEGEYGVSQRAVTAGGFVAISVEFDGTTDFMGGFNFLAAATDPYVP